jgi:Ca2+-binding EF-hand superfamily protein
MDAAFSKWDTDSSGDIDFDEFCDVVLPSDYTHEGALMHQIVRGFKESESVTAKDVELCPTKLLEKLDKNSVEKLHTSHLSTHQLVNIIRRKISQGSRGGNSEMGDAYALFGRPKLGISKRTFKHKLNLWGLFPSKDQLGQIFLMFDQDGNGVISFSEFIAFVGADATDASSHPLYTNMKEKKLDFVIPRRIPKKLTYMTATKKIPRLVASGKTLKQGCVQGMLVADKVRWQSIISCPITSMFAIIDIQRTTYKRPGLQQGGCRGFLVPVAQECASFR